MLIRMRDTGKVVTDMEFRLSNANATFLEVLTDSVLNDFGADQVFQGIDPELTNQYQIVVEQGVEEINGKWYTKKIIGPIFVDITDSDGLTISASQQELNYRASKDADKANEIRTLRNKLISECDWTQINDAPLTNEKKLEWATYRQTLRDIPQQTEFPWNVQWPTKPN